MKKPDGSEITVSANGAWSTTDASGNTTAIVSANGTFESENGTPTAPQVPAKPNDKATTPKAPIQPKQ